MKDVSQTPYRPCIRQPERRTSEVLKINTLKGEEDRRPDCALKGLTQADTTGQITPSAYVEVKKLLLNLIRSENEVFI